MQNCRFNRSVSQSRIRKIETMLPVETPQLRRQALFGGIVGSIFVTLATSSTVYSLKLDIQRKWYKLSPLRSVNLLVPSLGIHWEIWKGNFEHMLLFFDLQSIHSSQSGKNTGITMSPVDSPWTPSPTLSTTLWWCKSTKEENVMIGEIMLLIEHSNWWVSIRVVLKESKKLKMFLRIKTKDQSSS